MAAVSTVDIRHGGRVFRVTIERNRDPQTVAVFGADSLRFTTGQESHAAPLCFVQNAGGARAYAAHWLAMLYPLHQPDLFRSKNP